MRKALLHPLVLARELTKHPNFSKIWRFTFVSVVSTVITLGMLYVFFRVLKVGTAAESNLLATSIATAPAYYLNRTWTWGKTGKSHVMREVVPFWTIAIIGVLLSTAAVHYAAVEAHHVTHSKMGVTILVEFANFFTYGVLWVGKFTIFNRYLFNAPKVVPDADDVGPGGGGLTADELSTV
ncbi:MAG: GtrA family protein [Acidimicrobiales bacterium]|jgi:putative flippase GtrA